MNISLSRRVLRWLDPKREQQRQDLRMCLSKTQANGEDINRTVVLMNGHLKEHLAALKKK